MKKSANGNMYEVALDEAWELFGAHLSGARSGLVCVLSTQQLDERSRNALNSSAAALGYGRDACLFATLAPEGTPLDSQALFLLIEGVDPLCLVATDEAALKALCETYRCKAVPGKASRVFGRTCVAFRSFSRMLDDGQEKQVAWALLKKLPKRGDAKGRDR
ncbi:MAG: hypothetical protein PEGG_01158 [Paraeggerthella hongkongensis]|uniref:hypothetical protein n=1 Tax=Paraeggerthella TaxID=651554 RepID=UPI001CE4434E|nr:hypothetical protein [Paraeggerthella sp. Marseille-Q4926]MCD2432466.1 hypothetical protein [Paraeggerthella hominis]MDY3981608.1 hypothetical protein [Paraeggerthella sp.]